MARWNARSLSSRPVTAKPASISSSVVDKSFILALQNRLWRYSYHGSAA
jgi:hypothetical protein